MSQVAAAEQQLRVVLLSPPPVADCDGRPIQPLRFSTTESQDGKANLVKAAAALRLIIESSSSGYDFEKVALIFKGNGSFEFGQGNYEDLVFNDASRITPSLSGTVISNDSLGISCESWSSLKKDIPAYLIVFNSDEDSVPPKAASPSESDPIVDKFSTMNVTSCVHQKMEWLDEVTSSENGHINRNFFCGDEHASNGGDFSTNFKQRMSPVVLALVVLLSLATGIMIGLLIYKLFLDRGGSSSKRKQPSSSSTSIAVMNHHHPPLLFKEAKHGREFPFSPTGEQQREVHFFERDEEGAADYSSSASEFRMKTARSRAASYEIEDDGNRDRASVSEAQMYKEEFRGSPIVLASSKKAIERRRVTVGLKSATEDVARVRMMINPSSKYRRASTTSL